MRFPSAVPLRTTGFYPDRNPDVARRSLLEVPLNNNNNTFTWSGPSEVLGCTGQRRGAPLYGRVQPSTLNGRRLSRCAIERR
jgi:hypothetical protein